MSKSYYLVDKESLERKQKHNRQVGLLIENIQQLAKHRLTEVDYEEDVKMLIRDLKSQLYWLVEPGIEEICVANTNRCIWRISKDELENKYKTGFYVIQDEYGIVYNLEQFMMQVER